MAGGIKLAPLLTEIKVDIENFKSDMEKAAAIGTSEAKRISQEMETTAKVGEKFSKAGDLLTKGLTLPIVGVGAATTKMAVDFESSFAKVSTLLDSNVVDFAQYKNELLNASSETKVAVDEFSEAVYSSISAGVDQKEAIQFTTDAMKLAKGGFTDGAKAVDVLTTAINAYGLQASDATRVSDLLITTQNLGKTTVDELASSMGTVIPVANASNFSIEELSASYAQLTKNGVATAESGTYLKAMLSELSKSGSIADITLRELTGKGFADLKKEGTSTTEILSLLNAEAQKNDKTLKDMFGSVEAGSAALVLYKNSGEEYNEMLRGMETSAGATQKAFEKIDATPAEQLKGALNELRNEGVRFGAAFVPVIEKASDILGDVAEAFSELTDEQKENVVQWGITLAAAGPALKLIGGGIQTYTKLKTGIGAVTKALSAFGSAQEAAGIGGSVLAKSFTGVLGTCAPLAAGLAVVGAGVYTLHEQSDVLNSTVLKSREEMSWLEEALADLQGVTRYTKEELEEMGYVHKEFSDELSPEFQEAVEESTKKVQEFSVYLHEIGFDGIMTQEETDGFTKRVNDMCSEVISTIESRKEEAQSGLKDLFIADDQVIDESEQKVLELLSQSSDAQISEVQTLQDEILAIQQNAMNEKRQLNEQEIADIQSKNERIRQIELEALGGTEQEILYAKNEFAARARTMDLESASELLQEKAKIRDDEIVQIQAAYDTEIQLLQSKLSTCKEEDRAYYEEQIANLEQDKQKKITEQRDLYDEYLSIIEEYNPKLLDGISDLNGQILTGEEERNAEYLQKVQERYAGLEQITESGCYTLYNMEKGTNEDIVVNYDQATGKIVGLYHEASSTLVGYSKEIQGATVEMALNGKGSFEMLGTSLDGLKEKNGELVNANGDVVSSLSDIKKSADGTREGIAILNGTPCEVKVNKDGTIANLRAIDEEANNATRARTLSITLATNAITSGINAAISAAQGYSHYNGLDNVPYDGYQAVLHKGERVLTAEENKAYSNDPGIDYNKMEKCMKSAVRELTLSVGSRELGRIIDEHLRERGIL